MGRVFAYDDHNGWMDSMFIADHELSDRERFCSRCELWSELIGEVHSKEELISILTKHGITEDDEVLADTYDGLIEKYEKYSSDNYELPKVPKEELEVGLFFFVKGNFAFSGCALLNAEKYGDFLIYPESHFDVWEKYETLNWMAGSRKVDYDYFPRGRVVYRTTDETFIIYYDKCVEKEIHRISDEYSNYRFILELDEHYCCHECNANYAY